MMTNDDAARLIPLSTPATLSLTRCRTSASGGYPTGQQVHATFTAGSGGTADLSSYTDYACLHTTPRCAIAQQEWIVHIIVD